MCCVNGIVNIVLVNVSIIQFEILICSNDVPDNTLEEAAILAAFYSKAKTSSKVPVDYTLVKNLKKPNGAKPGMVIYHTNYTMYTEPKEFSNLNLKEA